MGDRVARPYREGERSKQRPRHQETRIRGKREESTNEGPPIAIWLVNLDGQVFAITHDSPQQIAAVAAHPGEGVYKQYCAACHDNPEGTRAPAKDTLKQMGLQFISYALTQGKMKAQGAPLSAEQRGQVISFLVGNKPAATSWTASMVCDAARLPVDLTGGATITNFGFDGHNTRSLTAAQAGLTKAQLSKMELAWAIGFPEVTGMRSQGAVVGKNVFVPVADVAAMYAFDISDPAKPCLQWAYDSPGGAPLRSSPAYGVVDGVPLLVFSGQDTTVHAVDARTGKAVWTKTVGTYSFSTTTGVPSVLKDRVIVPVAQFEIVYGGDNKIPCCNNHGYVLSLDPKTGEQQWRSSRTRLSRITRADSVLAFSCTIQRRHQYRSICRWNSP